MEAYWFDNKISRGLDFVFSYLCAQKYDYMKLDLWRTIFYV
jgi:hypothetical protein